MSAIGESVTLEVPAGALPVEDDGEAWRDDPIYLTAKPDTQARYTPEEWKAYIAGVRKAHELRTAVPLGALGAAGHVGPGDALTMPRNAELDHQPLGRLV